MALLRIGQVCELPPPNEAREFACGGRTICVMNVDGQLTAMDNVCIHRGGPLAQGTIENGKIVCPWHGWAFDAKTGELGPEFGQQVFPLKVEGDDVLVDI